jgi:hypothetical protein
MSEPETVVGPVTKDHLQGATGVAAMAGGIWWLRYTGQLTKLKYLFRKGRH